MPPGQAQGAGQARQPTPTRARQPTRKQKASLNPEKGAAWERSLAEWLMLAEEDEEIEGNEENSDLEGDLEVRDEDDWREDLGEGGVNESSASSKPEEILAVGPVLDLSDRFVLYVIPAEDGQEWRCQFEPPDWLEAYARKKTQEPLRQLLRFLATLARWLEKKKSDFLKDPSVDNFAAGEMDFQHPPIVTQKGLGERINGFAGDGDTGLIGEDRLSRLLKNDKVWLLWPDGGMPLSAVFTEVFKVAWAVQGCLALVEGEAAVWQREVRFLTRNDKKNSVKISAPSRDERLAAVCYLTGLDQQKVLNRLRGH